MKKAHLHVVPQAEWKSTRAYLGYIRHLKAYVFAQDYVRGKRVLEVGCGSGYGIEGICKLTRFITAVDIGMDALLEATERRLSPNVALSQSSGTGLPFKDHAFDTVISFQVIEHIANVPSYLREVRRVLNREGVFCLSTPNKCLRLLPFQKPWNPFHVREYNARGLENVLKAHFSEVTVYGLYGTSEIQEYEKNRVKQDPIQVYGRMFLPSVVRKALKATMVRAGLWSRAKATTKERNGGHDTLDMWKVNYSVDDFTVVKETKNCIDLVAVCMK